MKLNGLTAPAGQGLVLEVHADLIQPSYDLLEVLTQAGFEDDPFSVFHPAEFTKHMTGRLRVLKCELKEVLGSVQDLLSTIVKKFQGDFYFEIELVRAIQYFKMSEIDVKLNALDDFSFSKTGEYGQAKADVHVEFASGSVLPEVRGYLESKGFYWVSTPETRNFGPEEIGTLQTETFDQGQRVYDLLCRYPLPECTGIHLEQKLGMIARKPGLPMPEVIVVVRR